MAVGELFADFRNSIDTACRDSRAGVGAVVPAWQQRKAATRAFVGRLVSRDSLKLFVMGLLVASAVLHLYATYLNTDLFDYGSFWESGRAVNEGNNPYGV